MTWALQSVAFWFSGDQHRKKWTEGTKAALEEEEQVLNMAPAVNRKQPLSKANKEKRGKERDALSGPKRAKGDRGRLGLFFVLMRDVTRSCRGISSLKQLPQTPFNLHFNLQYPCYHSSKFNIGSFLGLYQCLHDFVFSKRVKITIAGVISMSTPSNSRLTLYQQSIP